MKISRKYHSFLTQSSGFPGCGSVHFMHRDLPRRRPCETRESDRPMSASKRPHDHDYAQETAAHARPRGAQDNDLRHPTVYCGAAVLCVPLPGRHHRLLVPLGEELCPQRQLRFRRPLRRAVAGPVAAGEKHGEEMTYVARREGTDETSLEVPSADTRRLLRTASSERPRAASSDAVG